ncbi:MAG: zinc-binding alcohol dehydrogenase [Rhizobacter sp.]|nr:zinc-binding alcohol dehydrogenase [Chlorobiales bacterium]
MFEKAKALVYLKANKLDLRDVEQLPMASGDVLVRTIATTITPGIERLQFTGKSVTRKEINFPIVSGSELVGEVLSVGAEVGTVQAGDYVFVSRADKWFDAESLFGCQAEKVLTGGGNVLRLSRAPNDVDLLTGLLAYCLAAARKVDLSQVERVLVLGLGSVGLMLAEVLRYKGVATIDAAEKFLVRGKLAAARDIAFDIEDFTSDYFDRYDLIIEATGRIGILEQATKFLKPQGRFLLLGNYEEMLYDYRLVQDKEPVMISSAHSTAADLQEAAYLISIEELPLKKFITHHFPIGDFKRAYDTALNAADAVKTVLMWQ